MSPLEKAAIASTPVPLLGDALGLTADMEMYFTDPDSRNFFNIAMTGASLLPFVPPRSVQGPMKAVQESVQNFRGQRRMNPNLDQSTAARMARAAEQGFKGPYYHGAQRMDRVLETGQLDPARATSGPMPYFTDNPDLASSYAKGKPDTSLALDDYSQAFEVDASDLGLNRTGRITVEQAYYSLPTAKKAEILEKAKRIGYADIDQATGKLTLHPEGVKGLPSSEEHFDYIMRTSARGNPLAALREIWLDSGNLYGEEELMENVYKLTGFDAPISQISAPWTEASAVLPSMIRMERPLNTADSQAVSALIPKLQKAFSDPKFNQRAPDALGADQFDKRVRFTPKEWVDQLAKDVEAGENSFVWTSIPDEVTTELKKMDYDGIIDRSGKMGAGGEHDVIIPFEPNQVRSINAEFDPEKIDSADLLSGLLTTRTADIA
tara:strand:- start:2027 stop:3334 length:1308 start_codon:yes stop_codon:yes gene_type:complete